MGPEAHLRNRLVSPVMAWPEGMVGLEFRFGWYAHEELGDFSTWPGVLVYWYVRSTSDPAGAPMVEMSVLRSPNGEELYDLEADPLELA